MPASWAGDPRGSRFGAVTEMMPLARYFVFVGGALMALLFVLDLFSPKAVANNSAQNAATVVDKSTLRIRSEQKWPERVVFDTTQPTIAPTVASVPTVQAALPGPEPMPEITPKARVRETFAQFIPVEPRRADTAVAKKRKIAKGSGQPMRVARSGFFGSSTW